MKTLKMHYSKKRRKFSLIFGAIWFFFILAQFLFSEQSYWFDYIMPVVGFLTTILYAFQYLLPYVKIENNILSIEPPFGKKIILSDIKQIKDLEGDILLKGEYSTIRLVTSLLDAEDVELLKKELKKHQGEWS